MMPAASGAFGTAGPFQFAPPKEFTGKKEDFEEFTFKLRAYLNLMDAEYEDILTRIEANLETEITDAHFLEQDGCTVNEEGLQKRAAHLQWILVALCTGPASTFLRSEVTSNGFESWRRSLHVRELLDGSRAS